VPTLFPTFTPSLAECAGKIAIISHDAYLSVTQKVIIGLTSQAFLMNVTIMFWFLRPSMRDAIEELFSTWSDIQTVTGLSLVIAGLDQFDQLKMYHLAVVLDLLSIAADGQAIMLYYLTASLRKANLRLVASVLFVALYGALAVRAYSRFRVPDDLKDCYLTTPPMTGNYGTWAIATALLVGLVDIGFCFQSKVKSLKDWVIRITNASRLLFPCAWILRNEIAFPIGTIIYFLWNLVDFIEFVD